MKERLTITLDAELLKRLDSTIDGVNVRNRSHAIERLLDGVLTAAPPKKAVILAGGKTVKNDNGDEVPKPMVMISERPILEYVIKEVKRNGITDILIIIGEAGDRITGYFGDGSLLGVRITYIKEDMARGTESALSLARGIVGNSSFFLINGDNLFKINMGDMYDEHVKTKATATIALVTSDVPRTFGVTKMDGFKVTSFVEKPEIKHGSALISAGIYIFSPAVFGMLHKDSKPVMLEKSLLPRLAESGNLYGYIFSTHWYPLETEKLKESIKTLEKALPKLNEK